jgi:hypothetical protein
VINELSESREVTYHEHRQERLRRSSHITRCLMGYRTPKLDRIANEGAIFTHYYGQQSCTAGRAAFITGQSPLRTGLLKGALSFCRGCFYTQSASVIFFAVRIVRVRVIHRATLHAILPPEDPEDRPSGGGSQ